MVWLNRALFLAVIAFCDLNSLAYAQTLNPTRFKVTALNRNQFVVLKGNVGELRQACFKNSKGIVLAGGIKRLKNKQRFFKLSASKLSRQIRRRCQNKYPAPTPTVTPTPVVTPTPTSTPTSIPVIPVAVVSEDLSVISGLNIPLDGSGSLNAESYSWTQIGGPTVQIQNASAPLGQAFIPETVPDGSVLTFRLTVERQGEQSSADLNVSIHAAIFENFLEHITSLDELGSTEGIAFNEQGMWIISFFQDGTPGFASLFNSAGQFIQRHLMPGIPDGANFRSDGKLIVANVETDVVEALDTYSGVVTTVASVTDTGEPLDRANYPLVDINSNIFVSNRTKVFRYDAAAQETKVFLDIGSELSPNGMSFGPEGNKIYIGLEGSVIRASINPDGSAGEVETYLTNIDNCRVDGITFDEVRNIYVGCPQNGKRGLFLAPYVASGTTIISRQFKNLSGSVARFVNPRFGKGGFGERNLFWTNLGDRSVGRLQVGLKELDKPLSPPGY